MGTGYFLRLRNIQLFIYCIPKFLNLLETGIGIECDGLFYDVVQPLGKFVVDVRRQPVGRNFAIG